jgi:hypothetical protein
LRGIAVDEPVHCASELLERGVALPCAVERDGLHLTESERRRGRIYPNRNQLVPIARVCSFVPYPLRIV